MNAKILFCVAFYGLINLVSSQYSISIGGIFDFNTEKTEKIFRHACSFANENILNNYNYALMPDIHLIDPGNERQVSIELCECLNNGVNAVFGPETEISAFHARSICDLKEIPFIETRWKAEPELSVINMYPAQDSLSQMLYDVIDSSSWKSFTILYESPIWLARVSSLLEYFDDPRENNFTIRQLNGGDEDNKNYRPMLELVKESEQPNIILECSTENLLDILDQMLQVSLLSKSRHLIITNFDLLTFDIEKYRFTGANITGFQLINSENLKELQQTDSPNLNSSEYSFNSLPLHTALVYDGVMLFAEAIKNLTVVQMTAQRLKCNSDSAWKNGYTIANYIKQTVIKGLTGEVRFDQQGLRTYIDVEIFELRKYGEETVANWNPDDRLVLIQNNDQKNELEDGPITEKTFRVASAINKPYCQIKESLARMYGNDRYEGYAIDLIEEISKLLKFKYVLQIYDNNYGKEINNVSKAWSGITGLILNNSADLVVSDFTMTSERAAVLDFTTSFMHLGIALLYREPTKSPPSTFSFMNPFSTEVWICLGCSYIAVSLCYFILGRISPFEWDNPYPCIKQPTELDNQFTITNSMWFAIGALLQQGSEMAPRSACTRVTSSVWWFFTLIIVSSYTANLAAFLVNENAIPLIKSVKELKECYKNESCPVEFGAKQDGATYYFFVNSKDDDFKEIGKYLRDRANEMPKDNDEGIERVLNKSRKIPYAFLMESSTIEYNTERKCNLTQVGGELDDKNYGIGMRQHYKYYDELSEAIIKLQESGKLAELKNRWWKEKYGGGSCDVVESDAAVPLGLGNVIGIFYTLIVGGVISILFSISDVLWETRRRCKIHKVKENLEADPLGIKNTHGIFLVLLMGSIIATLYAIIELILITYKRSKKYKLSFKTELRKEIVFLLTAQGNTKAVLHRKSPSTSPYSGGSYRSNKSRYSPMVQINGNQSVHHYK